MPIAKVYTLGDYTGTAKELAEIFCVTPLTMRGRLYRWKHGDIPLEKVLIYENDIKGVGGYGTDEWRALKDTSDGRPENLAKIKVGTFDNIRGRFDSDARRFSLPNMVGFDISDG